MRAVEPIRNKEDIERMRSYLKQRNERNYIMFVLGVSLGLRISDLLQLKKEDLLTTHIDLKEIKTTKAKRLKIPGYIKKDILPYAYTLTDGDYVLKSREGVNKAIDRTTAYRILKQAADDLRLKNIGTHSLRKTFGYHYYQDTKDIATLQELFNHSDQRITLKYIGVEQDELDRAMERFRI